MKRWNQRSNETDTEYFKRLEEEAQQEWDRDGQEGKCESCGKTTMIHVTVDPYLAEIEEILEECTVCRICYENRAGDI